MNTRTIRLNITLPKNLVDLLNRLTGPRKRRMTIKKGEIYLATLDPVIEREISKTRPVVVVSNDQNNKFSGTVTILPITSKNFNKIYPFEVLLKKGSANLPKN